MAPRLRKGHLDSAWGTATVAMSDTPNRSGLLCGRGSDSGSSLAHGMAQGTGQTTSTSTAGTDTTTCTQFAARAHCFDATRCRHSDMG